MKPTTATSNEIKNHLREALKLLRTLRDEVRLELHLGGMEAKTRLGRLDRRLGEVEEAARVATRASRQVLDEALATLKELQQSLRKKAGGEPRPPMH